MAHEIEVFWTSERILLAVVFVLGLLIGGFATNQYIDPFLNNSQSIDQNALLEMNSRLDSRNDELYRCLVQSSIAPESCRLQNRPVPSPQPPKDSNTPL